MELTPQSSQTPHNSGQRGAKPVIGGAGFLNVIIDAINASLFHVSRSACAPCSASDVVCFCILHQAITLPEHLEVRVTSGHWYFLTYSSL